MKEKTRNILRAFIEQSQELVNSRFMQTIDREGLNISLTFTAGEEGEATIEYIEIDREALKAFALTFRMFIQPNDQISLYQMSQLKDDDLSEDWKNAVLSFYQEYEKHISGYPPMVPVIDGKSVNRKEILDTIMYGDLSHMSKRKKFKAWEDIELMFPMLRNEFYLIVKGTVRGIKHVADLSERELNK